VAENGVLGFKKVDGKNCNFWTEFKHSCECPSKEIVGAKKFSTLKIFTWSFHSQIFHSWRKFFYRRLSNSRKFGWTISPL